MSLSSLSDEELLTEYRRRPPSARDPVVDELFGRHYERVARWGLRLTGSRDAAADLAQEVFLKAHRHLEGFRGTSQFSTWLYSIARNESLNRFARNEPRMLDEEVLVDVVALDPGPDALVDRERLAGRVTDFLSASLDKTERTVFTLHYGDDMPLDAITRLLSLTNASGAKAYIVSARRKLARATRRLSARGEQL